MAGVTAAFPSLLGLEFEVHRFLQLRVTRQQELLSATDAYVFAFRTTQLAASPHLNSVMNRDVKDR